MVHPIFGREHAMLRAVVDTGASTSVIPESVVAWFKQQGDPLAQARRQPMSVTLGDGRTAAGNTYWAELRLFGLDQSSHSIVPDHLPKHHPGYLALPRTDLLIGMDLLQLCRTLNYSGLRRQAVIDWPA